MPARQILVKPFQALLYVPTAITIEECKCFACFTSCPVLTVSWLPLPCLPLPCNDTVDQSQLSRQRLNAAHASTSIDFPDGTRNLLKIKVGGQTVLFFSQQTIRNTLRFFYGWVASSFCFFRNSKTVNTLRFFWCVARVFWCYLPYADALCWHASPV